VCVVCRYKIVGDDESRALYRECADHGVGLVAMKPYAGGQIFVKMPPISPTQCLAYVLSQPVSTAVTGVKNVEELRAALHYWVASHEEKDFGPILDNVQRYLVGDCVYCDHCLPCPQGINIGLVIHIADTAQYFPMDEIMAEYLVLPVKASECIACGECMERCPFDVDVVARMQKAAECFGSMAT